MWGLANKDCGGWGSVCFSPFSLSYLGIACSQIQNPALQPLQQGFTFPLWRLQGADRLPERTPNLLGDLQLEMRSAGHVIKT